MPINGPAHSFHAPVSSKCPLPAALPPSFTFFTFTCNSYSVGLRSVGLPVTKVLVDAAYSLLLLLGMLWGYLQVFLCFCDQHVPCCKISKTTGQSSLQFVVRVNYSCSLEAVNWHCTLLERCHYCHVHGVGKTTARVSSMTESAQPHISTSAWRSLFLYVHYTDPIHLYFSY